MAHLARAAWIAHLMPCDVHLMPSVVEETAQCSSGPCGLSSRVTARWGGEVNACCARETTALEFRVEGTCFTIHGTSERGLQTCGLNHQSDLTWPDLKTQFSNRSALEQIAMAWTTAKKTATALMTASSTTE